MTWGCIGRPGCGAQVAPQLPPAALATTPHGSPGVDNCSTLSAPRPSGPHEACDLARPAPQRPRQPSPTTIADQHAPLPPAAALPCLPSPCRLIAPAHASRSRAHALHRQSHHQSHPPELPLPPPPQLTPPGAMAVPDQQCQTSTTSPQLLLPAVVPQLIGPPPRPELPQQRRRGPKAAAQPPRQQRGIGTAHQLPVFRQPESGACRQEGVGGMWGVRAQCGQELAATKETGPTPGRGAGQMGVGSGAV